MVSHIFNLNNKLYKSLKKKLIYVKYIYILNVFQDQQQSTPLHVAAYLGDVHIMDLLIASGRKTFAVSKSLSYADMEQSLMHTFFGLYYRCKCQCQGPGLADSLTSSSFLTEPSVFLPKKDSLCNSNVQLKQNY